MVNLSISKVVSLNNQYSRKSITNIFRDYTYANFEDFVL